MALGSSQPLLEMVPGFFQGDNGRPAHKADNLARHLLAYRIKYVGSSASHIPMDLHALLEG
jgi:hypothetical protein